MKSINVHIGEAALDMGPHQAKLGTGTKVARDADEEMW